MDRRLPRLCLLGVGTFASCLTSFAYAGAPAIAALDYSADIGANLIDASTFVARKDYVIDDLAGTRIRQQIPGLPDTVILRDFHVEANDDILFALDIGATLGGTYFRPADVIRFDGTLFTREFDSVAAGVQTSAHCSGVARWGDTGKLLLSFDTTFTVAGMTIRPADVVAYSAGAFGPKILDAQVAGVAGDLHVDAIDTFRTKRYLLVSFGSGGTLGGISFTSADVMQFDRASSTWSRRYATATFSDRWDRANLDGVAALNVYTIFEDDFN